jgi:hypothetical protein
VRHNRRAVCANRLVVLGFGCRGHGWGGYQPSTGEAMRIHMGALGLGDTPACVVGATDPATGDTIASCPPTDTTAALTAISSQLAYDVAALTQPAAPAAAPSSNTGIYIGGAVIAAIVLVMALKKQ